MSLQHREDVIHKFTCKSMYGSNTGKGLVHFFLPQYFDVIMSPEDAIELANNMLGAAHTALAEEALINGAMSAAPDEIKAGVLAGMRAYNMVKDK